VGWVVATWLVGLFALGALAVGPLSACWAGHRYAPDDGFLRSFLDSCPRLHAQRLTVAGVVEERQPELWEKTGGYSSNPSGS
jgi:hypothetical protein